MDMTEVKKFNTTNKTARLLLILADFLEKLPEEKWTYRHYALKPLKQANLLTEDEVDGTNVSQREMEKSCGTVGCAAGWACVIPEFKVEGLRLVCGRPTYKQHLDEGGYQAMAKVLDISSSEAYVLFSDPESYGFEKYEHVRKEMVVRRLRVVARAYS